MRKVNWNRDHTPLISVVIPTYNRQNTITYCLKSVLAQTYKNFEILVVDDGSTDQTVPIVSEICDPRIRLIEAKKNGGAQAARNIGIKAAKGEWIAFLDSDDYWKLDKLEKQVQILFDHNFDKNIVIHSNCEIQVNGKITNTWILPDCNGFAYEKLLSGPTPMFQGLLVSKNLLKSIGLLDEEVPSYQEWDTAIRLAKEGYLVHMKEPTFVYCFHDDPTISKNKARDIEGYLYILHKHKNEILSINVKIYNSQIRNLIHRSIDFGLNAKVKELTNEFTSCRLRFLYRNYVYFVLLIPYRWRPSLVKIQRKLYAKTLKYSLRLRERLRRSTQASHG